MNDYESLRKVAEEAKRKELMKELVSSKIATENEIRHLTLSELQKLQRKVKSDFLKD